MEKADPQPASGCDPDHVAVDGTGIPLDESSSGRTPRSTPTRSPCCVGDALRGELGRRPGRSSPNSARNAGSRMRCLSSIRRRGWGGPASLRASIPAGNPRESGCRRTCLPRSTTAAETAFKSVQSRATTNGRPWLQARAGNRNALVHPRPSQRPERFRVGCVPHFRTRIQSNIDARIPGLQFRTVDPVTTARSDTRPPKSGSSRAASR
jgi:hypothetical protein